MIKAKPILRAVHALLFLLIIAAMPFYSIAQNQVYDYSFQSLTIDDGLSEGINAWISKDKFGFIWISSMDGLNRYDGKNVKVYRPNPNDPNSLSDNIVTSTFYEDHNGDLWFTTYGAINVYRRQFDHFESFQLKDETGNTIVEDYYAFHRDDDEQLWVRTGLGKNARLQWFDTKSKGSRVICPLKGQRIIVSTDTPEGATTIISSRLSGQPGMIIYSLDDGEIIQEQSYFHKNASLHSTTVYSVMDEQFPILWLATDLGIIKLDVESDQHTLFNQFQNRPVGKIKSIVHYNNRLYTSSDDNGILIFNKESETFEAQIVPNNQNNFSLRRKDISRLYLDREKCLWVSYFENGVREGLDYSNLGQRRFPIFRFSEQPANRPPLIAMDDNGHIYVSQGRELITLNIHLTKIQTNPLSHSLGILKSGRKGGVWGVTDKTTSGQYDVLYKSAEGTQFELVASSPLPIEDILETPTGELLLATNEGVYHLNLESRSITLSDSFENLHDSWVFHLYYDEKDRLYLSSLYDRLYIYDCRSEPPQLITSFTGVGDCKSFHFDESKNKTYISSSMGVGQVDFDTDSFRFVNDPNSFLSQQKYLGLLVDGSYAWYKTERGLIRLSSQDSTAYHYSNVDGVVHALGSEAPLLKDKKGRIWISGQEGINIFHPDSLTNLNPPPTPQIINISINDVPYQSDVAYSEVNTISLRHFENTVSIEFVPCQYGDPNNIHYEYRLKGHDENWVDGKSSGFARYFSLPPGEYLFEARTGNSDNQWSKSPAQLQLNIAPPIWATPFAYIFYGFAFLSLLWYIQFLERRKQQRQLEQQKKEVEQEKRINDELRKVDKLKDQFLANTSHELRTPLNGIIGLAESLIDGATGQLPIKTKENLLMIASSGKRLSSLVDDILDFSKIKSQDLQLKLKAVDLYSAVDIVMTLLNPLRSNTSVVMVNRVPRHLPRVLADENRLQQILYNLIGNAVKFTREGEIAVSASRSGEHVEVKISDTGIGIPETEFENIFRSFEQLDGGAERQFGGTGLGLSVTKQLVELHHGTITVTSEVGKGSTFTFTMMTTNEKADSENEFDSVEENIVPLVEIEPESNAETLTPIVQTTGDQIRILVVDDEPVNRQVLENHLSTAGYQIVSANDGQTALNHIENERFDLVLLDIMMPGLSGFQVCQSIREKHSAVALPIIMLTAKNRVSDLVEGLTSGANDYLTKPFSKDELMARIETHLSLRRVYRATGKFVPVAFLNAIGRDQITQVQLGDHTLVDVTVLFADIRDFTTLSESMTPTENFQFVNTFVGQMGPVIQRNGGFVNQYLGDGIMAIFPDSSENAIQASKEMMDELRKLNLTRREGGNDEIRIGIGLHSGPLIMGIIGDVNRTDPATIADTVNTSSRLEGLTKYYKANVIVSEESLRRYENHNNLHYRFLGKVKLKGKTKSVGIYEYILADDEGLADFKIQTHEDFTNAMKHYEKGELQAALNIFSTLHSQEKNDKVVHFFLHKVKSLIEGGLPPDWEATEVMYEK